MYVLFLFIDLSYLQEHFHICTLRWPDMTGEIVWNVVFTALCFLLPGFIIVASYSKILQVGLSISLITKMSGCEGGWRKEVLEDGWSVLFFFVIGGSQAHV